MISIGMGNVNKLLTIWGSNGETFLLSFKDVQFYESSLDENGKKTFDGEYFEG